jgi:hypothetical protein
MFPNNHRRFSLQLVAAAAILVLLAREALALREGGTGNAPIKNPYWPDGAAVIFNTPGRIAYWHGPSPGEWHADCRGDAKAFNAVLADFARLDVKNKKLVVHNGIGQSEWINISNDPTKREAGKIDWVFLVWNTADWKQNQNRRRQFRGEDRNAADEGPPAQIDVYTGGNIKWEDVRVPEGLKVVDQRLEAHGFTLADGIVLEGKVVDLVTKKPLSAMVRLERVEPQPKGGPHRYTNVAGAVSGVGGHWVLKKVPAGWHRVVIDAPGYLPCVAGSEQFDGQPKWRAFDVGLAKAAPVAGRVTDDAGQPLADVEVHIRGSYYSPLNQPIKTDKDGRFRAEQIAPGEATIGVSKPGYVRPGLSLEITAPKDDVELKMVQAARLEVTVNFTGKPRPKVYIVKFEPEGGPKIGSYGGNAQIDGVQYVFDGVPPGRYLVRGHPNPYSEKQVTDPIPVDLKGGLTTKVTVKAK